VPGTGQPARDARGRFLAGATRDGRDKAEAAPPSAVNLTIPADGLDPQVRLPATPSQAEGFAAGRADVRAARLDGFDPASRRQVIGHWPFWARPGQLPPDGDWRTWLLMAGRGFGKTRAGSEWVAIQAETHRDARIALVAATMAEARAVMVEGDSGLLSVWPRARRPKYEPSLRRLTWRNGAQAFLYSAAEPEALRGPQHHFAWADEIGKWRGAEPVWDALAMGLRLGWRPRTVVTTTPRATPLVRALVGQAGRKGVAMTGGATADNRSGLAPDFLDHMADSYGGSAFGRQELDGELMLEVEGALWTRALLDRCRGTPPPRERWARVVVGVDPPAGAGPGCDACGIVAVALATDGRAHVLADASLRGAGPERWARVVAEVAATWGADRVVAEANNGGAMVESVLRAADGGLPVRLVHASHGKAARAEPVSLLYTAGKVSHGGTFPELEDELAGLTLGGGYEGPGRSPDRADALVWAVTELMLRKGGGRPGVRFL